jgi:hypothetical protein
MFRIVVVPYVKGNFSAFSPPLDYIRRGHSIRKIDIAIQGDIIPGYGSYVRCVGVSRH